MAQQKSTAYVLSGFRLMKMCFVLFYPFSVLATLLFDEPFEVGDLYSWSCSSTKGSNALSNTQVRSGLYAFKSTIDIIDDWTSKTAILTSNYAAKDRVVNSVCVGFYFYLDPNFTISNGAYITVAVLAKSGIGDILAVKIVNSNGKLLISCNSTNGNTALSKQTWYGLEVREKNGTGDGEIHVFLNGIEQINLTSQTISAVDELRLGLQTSRPLTGGSAYFDDVVISTDTIGTSPRVVKLIHADYFGHLGMRIITLLGGYGTKDNLKATLTSDKGYSSIVHEKSAPLTGREEFYLNFRNLVTANYILTVKLLGVGGEELARVQETFIKPYDGTPSTGIDENNALCIKGKPFFPVGPFQLDRRQLYVWSNKYINMEYGKGFDQSAWNVTSYRATIDSSNKYRLQGCIGPGKDDGYTTINNHPAPTLEIITNYVSTLKNYSGILGWIWKDEPISNSGQSASLVRSWTALCHQLDPQHVVFNNEYGSRAGNPMSDMWFIRLMHTHMYPNQVADVNIFDTYPIEYAYKGISMQTIITVADWYRQWNYDCIPFMSFVETADCHPENTGSNATPAPTPDQLRMMIWIHIIHGAKGIFWYHYQGKTPMENFAVMERFKDQISRVQDVVLGPESKRVIINNSQQSGGRVDIMCRETDSSTYLFAARVTENAALSGATLPVTITVPGTGNVEINAFDEKRKLQIVNNSFKDDFAPCAVHIYQIPKSAVGIPKNMKESIPLHNSIYPNPLGFMLRLPRKFTKSEVSIFTLSGRMIQDYDLKGQALVFNTNIKPGMYFLKIGQMYIPRIIISE